MSWIVLDLLFAHNVKLFHNRVTTNEIPFEEYHEIESICIVIGLSPTEKAFWDIVESKV
jgi:hypothetical protein